MTARNLICLCFGLLFGMMVMWTEFVSPPPNILKNSGLSCSHVSLFAWDVSNVGMACSSHFLHIGVILHSWCSCFRSPVPHSRKNVLASRPVASQVFLVSKLLIMLSSTVNGTSLSDNTLLEALSGRFPGFTYLFFCTWQGNEECNFAATARHKNFTFVSGSSGKQITVDSPKNLQKIWRIRIREALCWFMSFWDYFDIFQTFMFLNVERSQLPCWKTVRDFFWDKQEQEENYE